MYESPILITQIGDQIGTELVEKEEEYVFSVVKRLYVDVDKDELVRALAYDRGQYEKGYSDGRAARDAEIVRCKDCVHHKNAPQTTDVWCERVDGLLPQDWFCADGERREDELQV